MQIDEAGSLTGTNTSSTRVCTLQGAVTLAEPGSAKNLYVVDVVAGTPPKPGTTSCGLSACLPHTGYAAIRFMPADSSILVTKDTRYKHTLVMSGRTGTGGYFVTQMSKQ